MEKNCPKCGTANDTDAIFCMKCGEKLDKPQFCKKCGEKVEYDMMFCPACGTRLMEDDRSPNLSKEDISQIQSKNTRILFPIVLAVVTIVVLCVFLFNNSKPNFQKAFEDAGGKNNIGEWVVVSGDGQSLRIDTNPTDEDEFYDSDATRAIRKINKALDLPDSLYDKMAKTRAIDGRQTATYEKVIVSWTYHPNHGLEILYERR